jgi:hypothetical protein
MRILLIPGVLAWVAATASPPFSPAGVTKAHSGRVWTVGTCSVGIGDISKDVAQLITWGDRDSFATTQYVRKDQFLVVCGALHRVRGIVHEPGNDMPGGSGDAAIIEIHPQRTSTLHPGSIVLTLGGKVSQLGPRKAILKELTLVSTRRGLSARFVVRLDEIEIWVSGAAGDSITIGPERYRVVAVTPPNAASGVPGWVELAPPATDR